MRRGAHGTQQLEPLQCRFETQSRHGTHDLASAAFSIPLIPGPQAARASVQCCQHKLLLHFSFNPAVAQMRLKPLPNPRIA